MAHKTAYFESAVLNLALRATSFSAPANVYVALFTTSPTDAYTSGSPDGVEVVGNAYARQIVTFGAPSGTPKQAGNSGTISFPAATPSGWGTIVAAGVFDALTNGNLLYWNVLSANKVVNVGDIFQFTAGTLTVSED